MLLIHVILQVLKIQIEYNSTLFFGLILYELSTHSFSFIHCKLSVFYYAHIAFASDKMENFLFC